jgi:hypothetical protein
MRTKLVKKKWQDTFIFWQGEEKSLLKLKRHVVVHTCLTTGKTMLWLFQCRYRRQCLAIEKHLKCCPKSTRVSQPLACMMHTPIIFVFKIIFSKILNYYLVNLIITKKIIKKYEITPWCKLDNYFIFKSNLIILLYLKNMKKPILWLIPSENNWWSMKKKPPLIFLERIKLLFYYVTYNEIGVNVLP